MSNTNEQRDPVKEARELAAYVEDVAAHVRDQRLARAATSLRTLCDEVDRQAIALTKLRDSTGDMWACSFAGEILKGASVDDALKHAERYDHA